VAHPGNDGVKYRVKIGPTKNAITQDIADFDISSEQYYMHVDPAVKVLATTKFPTADGPHAGNGPVDMPVVWTKTFGKGKVFYNSLGHQANIVSMPPVLELMRRGFLWAAGNS
jgi:type 1 glutamine amidotransferase